MTTERLGILRKNYGAKILYVQCIQNKIVIEQRHVFKTKISHITQLLECPLECDIAHPSPKHNYGNS